VRIVNRIEKINPNFYPVPVTLTRDNRWKGKRHGFLTKNQFISLYERCGRVLHAKNPFSKVSQRALSFESRISEFVSRVEVLLSEHLIRLSSSRDWLYVKFPTKASDPYFGAWLSPGKVSTSIAESHQ
jgi:hypothetical protein